MSKCSYCSRREATHTVEYGPIPPTKICRLCIKYGAYIRDLSNSQGFTWNKAIITPLEVEITAEIVVKGEE